MDISKELIKLAHKKLPEVRFEVADIETYDIPKDLDIIFAFASFVHVSIKNLKLIFDRFAESLNTGGVVCVSLKLTDSYREITIKDDFGIRTYYYYSIEDIEGLVKGFTFIKKKFYSFSGQSWIEFIIQKK